MRSQPDCLLVIDMQATPETPSLGFDAAYDPNTVRNCRELIRNAIKHNIQIVFMEYKGCGHTHPDLVELVESYDKVAYVVKSEDDGGCYFHNRHDKEKWKFMKIQVCGVNISACVQATVETLIDIGYDVEVVRKACNGPSEYAHDEFDHYPSAPNLVLA